MSRMLNYVFLLSSCTLVGLAMTETIRTDAKAAADGLNCQIRVIARAGGVTLKGMVRAPVEASGEYQFSVSQSGGGNLANINQGGEFSLRPGVWSELNEVHLNTPNSHTVARLRVRVHGKTFECRETIPGAI